MNKNTICTTIMIISICIVSSYGIISIITDFYRNTVHASDNANMKEVQTSDEVYDYYVYTYVASPNTKNMDITGEIKSFRYLGKTTEDSIMNDTVMYIIPDGTKEIIKMNKGPHIYIFENELPYDLAYPY